MIHRMSLMHASRRERRLEAVARLVAEQSVDAVVAVVSDRIAGMSLCEARGYIRARATAELRRRTRLSLRSIPESEDAWVAEIVARSSDRLGPIALRRCAASRGENAAERIAQAA